MNKRLPLILIGMFIIAIFAIGVVAYPRAPAELPIHWDLEGRVDSWAPKEFALFVIPAMMVPLIAILYAAIRWTLPATHAALGLWNLAAILAAHLLFQASMAAPVFGYWFPMTRALLLAFGLIQLGLGWTAPKLPPNVSMGIRLPWTLASEDVWRRTHRAAAWLLGAGAVVLFVGAALGVPMGLGLLVGTGVPLIGSVMISYIVWRRERAE